MQQHSLENNTHRVFWSLPNKLVVNKHRNQSKYSLLKLYKRQ